MSDERSARIAALQRNGVRVPVPESVEIDDDVDLLRIAPGVTLEAGTRVRGAKTFIGPGTTIGREAPMTIVDCRVGADVSLAGGFAEDATFLDGAKVGSGAHIRPGCLLEEHASVAHTVGIKQTILFPYVTLGSLINFCDCLMAGGSGPKDHSEVGSSYIHFNFTPHQDKATPSLFGDVPRGVRLDQRPIFLGGQGGAVGPLRVGYGAVAPAGTVLRRDVDDGAVILDPPAPVKGGPFVQGAYRRIERVVRNNVHYLANLVALDAWYRAVRCAAVAEAAQPLHLGAVETIRAAIAERIKQFRRLASKMPQSILLAASHGVDAAVIAQQQQLADRADAACDAIEEFAFESIAPRVRDRVVAAFGVHQTYLETVRTLEDDVRRAATEWLDAVVGSVVRAAHRPLDRFALADIRGE